MSARFTVTVEGIEVFKRGFNRIDERIKDFTPIWKAVKFKFWDIEKDQFQSGGAKGASGKWAELSPKYAELKVKEFGTFALIAGVLRRTDALYESLTGETEHTVFEANKTDMAIGTNLPYAKYHQTGGGNLPKRPPIDLSDESKILLQKEIQKELLSLIDKEIKPTLVITEDNFRDFV